MHHLGDAVLIIQNLLWCHRKMVASMESKQIYNIFHISEISIGLPYIRLHLVWWLRIHIVWPILFFADFHFGPYRGKFVDIPYVYHFWGHYGFAYFERRFKSLSISRLSC